jgi:Holliday junction resolvase
MEKDLQRKVLEFLKYTGAWFYHPRESKKGTDGLPDIIGCIQSKFFAIELKNPSFKSPEKKLRPEQIKQIEKIKKAGGFVLVSNNFEEIVNFINFIRRL